VTAINFPPYRLDLKAGCLWRDHEVVRLRPKTWEVLRVLVGRAGELVTTQELLREVWPGVNVSAEVPAVSVREIRRALGEQAGERRFVETVPARGFRFVATVEAERDEEAAPRPSERPRARQLVAREGVLELLARTQADALLGNTQVTLVEGEAGIGKSVLVDAIVRSFGEARAQRTWCARGQCIELAGAREELMPIFTALAELARGEGAAVLTRSLRRHAPSSLRHIASLEPEASDGPSSEPAGGPRRLRELTDAIAALAQHAPLLLVLEDLHAADASTLGLVELLLRRRDAIPLWVVASVRARHEVRERVVDLYELVAASPTGSVVTLDRLTHDDVARYLRTRLDAAPPEALVETVHAYSEGLPRWMVQFTDWVVSKRALVRGDDGALRFDREAIATSELPEALRAPLVARLRAMPAQAMHVLEAASVVGDAFEVATVAAALEHPLEEVESICAGLTRLHGLLRQVGHDRLDASASPRYAFVQPLARAMLYEELRSPRRAALHLRVARELERAHRQSLAPIAGELAMHFRLGEDARTAALYQVFAAQVSMRRGAASEALEQLDTADGLLEYVDATERPPIRARIALSRGAALTSTRGYGDDAAAEAYGRARALAIESRSLDDEAVAIDGLGTCALASGNLRGARALAEELDALAIRTGDAAYRMSADARLGETLLHAGRPRLALKRLERCRRATRTAEQRGGALLTLQHPAVTSRSNEALVLWFMGLPDRAIERAHEAIETARDLVHPPALAYALNWAAVVHQLRGEIEDMEGLASEAVAVSQANEWLPQRAFGQLLVALAQASRSESRPGRARALLARAGGLVRFGRPYVMAIIAEIALHEGASADATVAIDLGLEAAGRSGELAYVSELHRLRAVVSAALGDDESVEPTLRRAVGLARDAGMAGLALRSATELAGHLTRHGRAAHARALIAETLPAIRGGERTRDVVRARALFRTSEARLVAVRSPPARSK
jgi:DNA-binding winged helix-turn-helix (wHTH) protein/tetratricopeptide (TPR) repeat protein